MISRNEYNHSVCHHNFSLLAVQHERGPRKSKNKSNTDHHNHHHHQHQTNTPSASSMASHQTPTPMIPMLRGVTIEGPIDLRVQPPPAKSETVNMANMSVGKNESCLLLRPMQISTF